MGTKTTKIFRGKTKETVESLHGAIKLITIVGGDMPGKPGEMVDEELHLYMGDSPKKLAGVCLFLWSRFNGVPFEKPSLESLIKTLREQKALFKPGRKRQPNAGRPSEFNITSAELNVAIKRYQAHSAERRTEKDKGGKVEMRAYVKRRFWPDLAKEIRPNAPERFSTALSNMVYKALRAPKRRR